jgi:hypothetical protein
VKELNLREWLGRQVTNDHIVLAARAFSEGKRKCAQRNYVHTLRTRPAHSMCRELDDFLFLFFLFSSSSLMAAYKSLTIRPLNEKEEKKEGLSVHCPQTAAKRERSIKHRIWASMIID